MRGTLQGIREDPLDHFQIPFGGGLNLRQVIVFGVILEALYLAFFFSNKLLTDIRTFIVVNAVACILLTYIVYKTRAVGRHVECNTRRLRWIIGFAILFRLTLLPHDPVATDDIYRYVWDGKVAAEGINPFRYAPSDPHLESLHGGDLPAKINFPKMRTIYPPLAQGLFLGS